MRKAFYNAASLRIALLAFSLLAAPVAASSECRAETPQKPQRAQNTTTTVANDGQGKANVLPTSMLVLNVAEIAEQVNSSVVNIQSAGEEGASFGSGFFVDGGGLIVTNYHVIREAIKNRGEITVVTTNDNRYPASVKGYDESTDIALLEIKPGTDKLSPARLGDSDRVRVGEWAVAVGSPYGLDHTVTLGIISAKGRSGLDGEYDDYLQTDAAINFGNSGGPLINTSGEVIGINTLVLAKGQGLGFAIPVNILKEILPQLRDSGRVRRSALAIETTDLNVRVLKNLRIPQGTRGIVVGKVERDTTAAKAGLRRDDIIIAVNNTPITSMGQFNRMISRLTPGSQVEIKILREEREFVVKAELIEKK